MILVEFKESHWSEIADPIEPFSPDMQTEDFFKMVKNGVSITGMEDGKVMACGGVSFIDDENGMAWLKASQTCLLKPLKWARRFKDVFRVMREAMDVEVATYVLSGFCQGDRVARLIGMKSTGEETEQNGNTYIKYTVK
jgi:hypothetical protein